MRREKKKRGGGGRKRNRKRKRVCVYSAAAPEMLLLWMSVFGFIGAIWGVTILAERLRKSNEQVLTAAAVHMTGMCIALCCPTP